MSIRDGASPAQRIQRPRRTKPPLRRLRGLALPALGARVGRSGQQIQKYEVGQDAIKAATLYQLAEALGVRIEWFFEGMTL